MTRRLVCATHAYCRQSRQNSSALDGALHTLGAILVARGQTAPLVLVGGGALVLLGLADRSTKDLDVVARVEAGHLRAAEPFSPALVEAIADVALALDLAPAWLNLGPASLLRQGLPPGLPGARPPPRLRSAPDLAGRPRRPDPPQALRSGRPLAGPQPSPPRPRGVVAGANRAARCRTVVLEPRPVRGLPRDAAAAGSPASGRGGREWVATSERRSLTSPGAC